MKFVPIVFLSLLLLGCQPSKPSKESPAQPFDKLEKLVDQYAENALKKGNMPSLAIAIYKDGLSYENYYGERSTDGNNPPNGRTQYEIASISKIFVGSLAARAVLENKIALEDDIRMYLGEGFDNLEFEGTPVTIQNLLTHTIGFQTPQGLRKVYRKTIDGYYEKHEFEYGMKELFEELQAVKLDHKPGTVYDYNNVGPELVAYILEKVYGREYSDLLQAFFDELNLTNTFLQDYISPEKTLSNESAADQNLPPLDRNPLLGGSFGIVSTLPDLTKFMTFQLEANAPFIKESSRMLFEDGEDNTGYLWDVGVGEKEGRYYVKTGTSNGVQSCILLCPDTNYGLVLITDNTSDAALNDWASLYHRIEYDLIEYPKINAWSMVASEFVTAPEKASKKYIELSKDTSKYFASSDYLNKVGYDLLYNDEVEKAIKVFELAISQDLKNANLYDSLGEALFKAQKYQRSKDNYQKSLALHPDNSNAKKYLKEIDQIMAK
ncbi:MAG: serine hydrolase [Bacteroidota bacterium]